MLPSQTQRSSTFVSSQSVTLPWLSEPLDEIPRRCKDSARRHLNKNKKDQGPIDLFDDSDEEEYPEYPDFTALGSDNETTPASDEEPKQNETQGSEREKPNEMIATQQICDQPSASNNNSSLFDMEGPAPKVFKATQSVADASSAPTCIPQQFGTHGTVFEPVAKKPCHQPPTWNAEEPSNALPVISKPTPVHITSLFLPLLPRVVSSTQNLPITFPTPTTQNLLQFASATSAFFPFPLLTQQSGVQPQLQRGTCIVRKRPAGNF
ncbi:unnamed protein product [Caenorhabditis brenneri]